MPYKVENVKSVDFIEIADLWESSVRATHHFLKEEDITYYKDLLLNKYLVSADLKCVRDENKKILGFLGVNKKNIDMLFIHPDLRGKGVGKFLTQHAIAEAGAQTVDVNEDNYQAVGFYEHVGFKIISRSKLDSTGKPYPILHMKLDIER